MTSPSPGGLGDFDSSGLPRGYPFKPDLEYAPRDLASLLAHSSPPLLIDVRLTSEWDFARIPGAIHIPLHQLEDRLDEIREALASADRDRQAATYCHHGVRSMKAALLLRHVGLGGVRSLAGGIDLWSLVVDGSIPRYERNGSIITPAPRHPAR